MDKRTAQELSDMTSAFYAQTNASFSATRQTPWPGWEHVLACMQRGLQPEGTASSPRVLDVACGNLRFEKFLFAHCPRAEAWCVDNCEPLVTDALAAYGSTADRVHYQHLDIAQTLLARQALSAKLDAPACDLTVCFGFMHHLPLAAQRLDLLKALVAHTKPGGIVAVSFWQFLRDARIRAKARTFAGAQEGDYLLGWQDRTDVARYCHHFEEEEISALVSSVAHRSFEVMRFSADGRSGDLNRYVVLRARP